ncbi:putative Xaa-Pro aminopeptidase 3 [Aphelenchoides besseyi]|nr:putative Xaa-Pro aminopeptidase 3 [Aphelenchoides besseyi]
MNRASSLFTGRLCLPPPIHPSEFANRRHKLIEILKSQCKSPVVLIRGNLTIYSSPDVPYNFRQCSHFRYLTNCNEPKSVFVQTENRSTLFVYKKTDNEIVWEGPQKSIELIKTEGAFDEVLPLTELPAYLASQLRNGRTLAGDNRRFDEVIVQELVNQFSGHRIDVLKSIDQLRWIKSNAEIDHMRCAAKIGSEALNAVMQQARGIADESTIVGLLEYEMRRRGADCTVIRLYNYRSQFLFQAYPSVVGGGDRCNTIHYIDANNSFDQDDSVLIDAGAFFRGYCSDITRCFPISGRFSSAQRELYEALYSVQEECLDFARNIRPLTLYDLYMHMVGVMAETLGSMSFFSGEMNSNELIKETENLCPHHVSHYLGCDVHDSPTNSVVITVEPGKRLIAFITSLRHKEQ